MIHSITYFITNLYSKWFNVTGIISGTTTYFLSWFQNMTVGSFVGILITAGIGIFSILKARQDYIHKVRMDELEYQKELKKAQDEEE